MRNETKLLRMIYFFFNKQLLLKRDTEQKNDPVHDYMLKSSEVTKQSRTQLNGNYKCDLNPKSLQR